MRFTLTSQSPGATAAEGWSGVQDRTFEGSTGGLAAIAWFASEVIANPEACHFLRVDGKDHVLAGYEPFPE